MGTQIVPGLNGSLLKELVDEFSEEHQLKDDVTVSILAAKTGYSDNTIRRKLEKKIEAGELIKIWGILSNGYHGWIYRKPPRG